MKESRQKYNKITLQPKNEVEKDLFWQFRVDDIAETMGFFIIFNICFWIVSVLAFITDSSNGSLTKALLYTGFLTLYIIVWKIRNRFKKQLVYMLMFLYIYMQILLYTLSSSVLIAETPEEDE